MMTILRLGISIILMAGLGCGRYNSEFAAPNFNGLTILKPTCKFKPSRTCWMEDLEKLASCGENTKTEALDFFDEDYESCDNYRGKLMIFDDITTEALKKWQSGSFGGYLAYNMKSKGKQCYSFEGTARDFTIESKALGQLAYRELDSGEIQVKCFNGEFLKISPEVVQSGCANSSLPTQAFLPRAELKGTTKSDEKSLALRLFGVGSKEPYTLFQCY